MQDGSQALTPRSPTTRNPQLTSSRGWTAKPDRADTATQTGLAISRLRAFKPSHTVYPGFFGCFRLVSLKPLSAKLTTLDFELLATLAARTLRGSGTLRSERVSYSHWIPPIASPPPLSPVSSWWPSVSWASSRTTHAVSLAQEAWAHVSAARFKETTATNVKQGPSSYGIG